MSPDLAHALALLALCALAVVVGALVIVAWAAGIAREDADLTDTSHGTRG